MGFSKGPECTIRDRFSETARFSEQGVIQTGYSSVDSAQGCPVCQSLCHFHYLPQLLY